MARYQIVIADNFHYMDKDEHVEAGIYESYEAAVAACREIVDDSVLHQHKPGMSADELFKMYSMFGDDPFIVLLDGAPTGERFSAWDYARERCRAICG